MARRGLDLSAPFPELGLDIIESETRIECLLIGCRHEFAAAPERRAVKRESCRRRMLGKLEKMAVASRRLHEDRAGVHGRRHHDLRARAPGESQCHAPLVLPRELVHAR